CAAATALALAACAPAPAALAPARARPVALQPAPAGPRLPDTVAPARYDLELDIDPNAAELRGRVTIDVAVRVPVRSIWLHAVDLAIDRVELRAGGRERVVRVDRSAAARGLLGIHATAPVPAGTARITIAYRARLGQRVGAFRQRVDGRWYAFSDFEPIDARRAIPCFDEPRFKTPWTVAITAPRGLRALSNAPEVATTDAGPDRVRHAFATTRPLPTYLVAFAVGPFALVDGPRAPVPLRAAVYPGHEARALAAVREGAGALARLQAYTGQRAPVDKIDLVAVPSFNGAMENPGLITVAADILLVDPDRAPPEARRRVAMVVAHELAHLWFGDLVTPAWWDDLWLNEAFASWMADRVVAAMHPGWHWELERVRAKADAVDRDAAGTLPPLRRAAASDADIRTMLGSHMYTKGPAIVAMLERVVGDAAMRAALRGYLRRHADGVGTTPDLLAALSAAGPADLGAIAKPFLNRRAVPVVGVELRCGERGASVRLSQGEPAAARGGSADAPGARAALAVGEVPANPPRAAVAGGPDGGARTARARRAPWIVPACVRTPAGTRCARVGPTAVDIALPGPCPAWVYPNAGERGYYLYAPGAAGAAALRAHLRDLGDVEWAGLALNAWMWLRSGAVPVDEAARALVDLAASDRDAVVDLAVRGLTDLAAAADRAGRGGAFRAYLRAALGPRARSLGLRARDGDDDDTRMLRPRLARLVGVLAADPALAGAARREVEARLDRGDLPRTDELELALEVAGARGDDALFRRYADALARTDEFPARLVLWHGLASLADPALARRAVDAAFAPGVTPGERAYALYVALRNPTTRATALSALAAAGRAARVPAAAWPALAAAAADACAGEEADALAAVRDALPAGAEARAALGAAIAQVRACVRRLPAPDAIPDAW
ncbi:MAG: M1 family peptidase, partial [Deltaproteobacteria bacterium]